ncbi:hypothetical protein Hanom_Chr08g00707541 [Helianthus anomalus]
MQGPKCKMQGPKWKMQDQKNPHTAAKLIAPHPLFSLIAPHVLVCRAFCRRHDRAYRPTTQDLRLMIRADLTGFLIGNISW